MALELITEDNSGRKAFIFTDNYAEILSSEQLKQQSGHYASIIQDPSRTARSPLDLRP